MEDEEDVLLAVAFAIIRKRRRRRNNVKKQRTVWVRDIFKENQRNNHSVYHTLVQELRLGDREYFFK